MVEYNTYKAVESFYGGGGSSLEPDINSPFVGYRLSPSQIGFSTNPTTGDQLGETMRGIRAGAKVIEVNLLRIGIQGGGDSDQVIPIQHFNEIRALSKITGVKPSIHGPLIDAAGFSEREGRWSEENRDQNERIMFAAMEKAKLADPDKNIPVIFHSSNLLGVGTHYKPEKKDGKTIFKEELVPIFNRQTKQLNLIDEKMHYNFGGGYKGGSFEEIRTADKTIEIQNNSSWEGELKSLTLEKRYADQALAEAIAGKDNFGAARGLEAMKGGDPFAGMSEDDKKKYFLEMNNKFIRAETLLNNNRAGFNSLFSQAYEYGTPEQKKALKNMSDLYSQDVKSFSNELREKRGSEDQKLLGMSNLQDKYFGDLREITENGGAPETYVRGENFAMGEAAKTFGNVATKSYKKLGGENAPMVAIENVWNGAMFSRGKDMKELVEKSRQVMVNNLVREGMSDGQAKNAAEKLIGMNFDVGHLNIFRKKGFETKDIVGEVKEFAPYVKHMHLTDNFGFSDEHLYPGQGNVPFKKLFETLKEGNPNFDKDVKKIVETGGVEARHMGGRSAHAFNLAAFGVPIFGDSVSTAYTGIGGPATFDRALNTFGNYFGGYGNVNPEIHHSLYGASFSGLPSELGGVIPGMGTGRSRFSGTPMA